MGDEELMVKGVGEYTFAFYDNDIRTEHQLKYIQEDSIVESKNKKFLVLRHASIDPDVFSLLQIRHTRINILGRHIVFNLNEKAADIEHDKYSIFQNARFKYMRLENEVGSFGSYKIVFEVEDIKLMQDIESL